MASPQKTDIPGSKDHPLISRYPGLAITMYSVKDFDDFLFPLGKLDPSSSKFAKSQRVEGKVTRIYYEYPENRSTLEIFRNYETALKNVSFHVYGSSHGIQLDVIEPKPMEGGLVTVDAAALGNDIAQNGHTAVYGIFFDSGKADVKPESEPALREIAKLLQENAKLQLYVVGHTDAIGTLNSNMDLSQRRAEATVNVLTGKYGVALVRLRSWGDGPTAPVATNKTEDGRAKNRRVELVEQ
jgi:outer membrane protein OmpA-like peptidoglycan-associated protein